MSEVSIILENCNCIKKGCIKIETNALNIKYGLNGVGKSTLSRAIYLKANKNEEEIRNLLPYGEEDTNKIAVDGVCFNKVMIFDEKYVNSYLFEKEGVLENSFNVFLRSEKCEELSENITKMLNDLKEIFNKDSRIRKLEELLPSFNETLKYSNGNISKKGGVGEFLKGNGAGFDKYVSLSRYKPFYTMDTSKISKWAKWRNDGTNYIIDNSCPFCTEKLQKSIIDDNNLISKVFKNSALTTASSIIEYLENAKNLNFISEDSYNKLIKLIDTKNVEAQLTDELEALARETNYLIEIISKIQDFKPLKVTLQEVNDINNYLDLLIIDKGKIDRFYNTNLIFSLADDVQSKVQDLKKQTGLLTGLFKQYNNYLNNIIRERREDINYFFKLAGFPYKFEFSIKGEDNTSTFLVPNDIDNYRVTEPNKHLSWGEKNAFSLVMFMFEAINNDVDLIILDDPITSFDKDKKYAVIKRLFDNKRVSFTEKTVLMITHDLQPLIDLVYNNMFKRLSLSTKIKACYIENDKGLLNETDVSKQDLINCLQFSINTAKNPNYCMPIRVVNLRKYIEMTNANYFDSNDYSIVSNLIHGRIKPLLADGTTEMNSDDANSGMEAIKEIIGIDDYGKIIEQLKSKELFNIITNGNNYEKIIAVRLLFERNGNMLLDFRRKHFAACKFINESNHVENDYIFQLDPTKYFDIPSLYLEEIIGFLKENEDKIIQNSNQE